MTNILLIEPDALLAASYCTCLISAGYAVRAVTTAESAIYAADECCPDLVILELHLVRHNGLEFLYEFRSYVDWQKIPVLVLSSAPASEFADSWSVLREELGVVAYMYKPLTNMQKLQQQVRQFSAVSRDA